MCNQTFGRGVQRCPLHGRKLVEAEEEPEGDGTEDPTIFIGSRPPEDEGGATTATTEDGERDPQYGRRFNGRFLVEERIGEGGMGIVYRGKDLAQDPPESVAIKVLKAGESDELGLEARFKREAKLVAKLDHPNTIRFVDWGASPDGTLFLVTELLKGQPLDVLLEAHPSGLGEARTLSIVDQIAASLEDAHALGVIHRDLKPANVFVDGDQAKLLDFGIARIALEGAELSETFAAKTRTGMAMFTPMYCSPEQSVGDEMDHRSDIYSLGVVAYHCLAGKTPFAGGLIGLLEAHLSKDAPPIAERSPGADASPGAEAMVRRMMEKAPGDRFQSASEVRAAIAELRGVAAPAAPSRDPGPSGEVHPPPSPPPSPARLVPLWVVGALFVALAVFIMGLFRVLFAR